MARLQSDWILEKETAYLILERFLFTSRFGAWSYSGLRGVFFLGRLSPFNHQKSHNIEILWCFWRFLLKRFYRLHNFLAHFYQPLVLWSYGWSWGFLGTFVPFGLPWSNFETFKTLGKNLKIVLTFLPAKYRHGLRKGWVVLATFSSCSYMRSSGLRNFIQISELSKMFRLWNIFWTFQGGSSFHNRHHNGVFSPVV